MLVTVGKSHIAPLAGEDDSQELPHVGRPHFQHNHQVPELFGRGDCPCVLVPLLADFFDSAIKKLKPAYGQKIGSSIYQVID